MYIDAPIIVTWSWYYDYEGYGPYCEGCNKRFYPDCDISSASTAQEFERHMASAHEMYPVKE